MSSGRVTFLIVVAAVVAIVAVVVAGGGIDLPGGGDDDGDQSEQATADTEQGPVEDEDLGQSEPEIEQLPESPDEVRGSDDFSLTRPANLRRALAVLERERRPVEGVYDGLRVAPGRIDTVIIHPDDRRTNIQVVADLQFTSNTHDFPTPADFREDGITARDVDVSAPAKLLREIDRIRDGSAAHDIDYFVIDRNIIDASMDLSAYMRIRTPRPRMFSKEPGQAVRVIG